LLKDNKNLYNGNYEAVQPFSAMIMSRHFPPKKLNIPDLLLVRAMARMRALPVVRILHLE
jgi:hypothetical protein